jgi:hypothetical protein
MIFPSAELAAAPLRKLQDPRTLVFWAALALVIVAGFVIPSVLPWADVYPKSWIVPFTKWIGTAMDWLVKEADLGLFTFQEFTRGIAWVMNWPLKFLNWSLWARSAQRGLFRLFRFLRPMAEHDDDALLDRHRRADRLRGRAVAGHPGSP